MNRWKFRRNTSRLILVLASLLTLIIIVITGVSVYASTPDAAIIAKIEGTGLKIGERTSRDREAASKNQQLRGNKVLYVPGNGSLAYLGFIVDAPLDTTGLLVSAGPSKTPSEWSFPCTAKGGFTIAWKDGSDRGCEAGVKVQSSSKKGGLPNNNLQASRRLLAQAEDEVTVVPTPGKSTIQTADSAAGISVNVLVGNVRVKSAKNPGGRLVKAGERYNYPQDTITPIDINPIVNSPEMQEFLNPDNWSSPNIPQRIADGFSEQLGEMRTALGRGLPAVASNSGVSIEFNTDRNGSDYTSFDLPELRPELCQAACANDSRCQAYTYVKPGYFDTVRYKARCFLKEPAPPKTPAECCVSGIKSNPSQIVWNLDYPTGMSPDGRTCIRTGRANLLIFQTGTSLNGKMPVFAGNIRENLTITGTITETKVQMETATFAAANNFSVVFNGVRNQNGEIVGTATQRGTGPCNSDSDYFKMTR